MHTLQLLLADTSLVMFGKLTLAMILGAVLGTERAILAHQAAGTRTFGLVSLASCLFVLVSNFLSAMYLGVVSVDPSHIPAAIISGIGFIGAGLIIFKGDTLHGITTAAGLWIAAAVGIAVGVGLYSVALYAELLALIMFTGMWYIENSFKTWFSD